MPLTLNKKKKSYLKGWWSEIWVALILWCQGYKILVRRFRCPVGEIDLIVRRGDQLVAVEVKNRSTLKSALESISVRQQRRIHQALQWYTARHVCSVTSYRFDVVVLYQGLRWYHLKNAWQIS